MTLKHEKPLILIVDDVMDNLQILRGILRSLDCRVSAAVSGRQVLETVEQSRPDLILLDVMMPEMDGFEVCRRLKETAETAAIPVIFITAKNEMVDLVEGFKLGAVDYITKPFQNEELLARISTQLTLIKQNRALQDQSEKRKALLHILCHDLATPFNSIDGYLEFFEMGIADLDEFKELVAECCKRGKNIIDLVRKLRSLDDGKYRLELEPVNLKIVLEEAYTLLRKQFNDKEISFICTVPSGVHVTVEPISFQSSVINNLLTNAIKFSYRNNQVIVHCEVDGSWAVLSIKDNGMGMPVEITDNIFDITKLCTREGTEGEQGTGFGMPLVKRFIEEYGGRIELASVEDDGSGGGHGTDIRLVLPCVEHE